MFASLLAHGLVLAAVLGWSRHSMQETKPPSPMVELEFSAPAPSPNPPISEPQPTPESVPETVSNPSPTPIVPQTDEPTPQPAPQPVEAPKQIVVPPQPKPERPKPQPRPIAAQPVQQATAPTPTPPPVANPTEASAPAPPQAAPTSPPPINPDWRRSLGAWIGANRVYPENARRSGTQGNVSIRFTVDRLGHVLTMDLVRSSGSTSLDEAALAMLKGANLPPFPAEMTQESLTVTVQIHYSLTH